MVKEDSEQDYQDPILTPGNLKRIVQNLPGRSKSQSIDYDYHKDARSFETEINEFFSYTEVTIHLQDYCRLYEKEFRNSPDSVKDIVILLLDQLENSDQRIRIKTCQQLVHISINSIKSRENDIIQKNNELFSCNYFYIFYQKLLSSCMEYHETKQNQVGICTEIDLYLTLIYILIETQRLQYHRSASSNRFQEELTSYDINLIELLFSTIAKTRENGSSNFPIKKAMLVLWKSILLVTDDLENVKYSKAKLRESLGLRDKNTHTKSSPQDLLAFKNETSKKYPGFTQPDFPIPVISPLILTATKSLSKAMGYSKATEDAELLYQVLFPPKTTFPSLAKGHFHLQDYYYPDQNNYPLPLPLTHTGLDIPKSIKEAGDAFISNMHVSLGNFQIIQERGRRIQQWQNQNCTTFTQEKTYQDKTLILIEKIYSGILPHIQNFNVVVLKLLLTSMDQKGSQLVNTENRIKMENLEQIDAIRNKEIISKSISGILLSLLKWTKVSHILKFEYFSQMLVDSGYLLLILKMIGLHEMSERVKIQTDVPHYSVFDYNRNRSNQQQETKEATTNNKTMYWIITLVRVLQMLTNHKPHRIMLMAQYKSPVILKRLLAISHPVLEKYVLKLIKSQVPYLGKKWRSQNMKTISAIYLNCKTTLEDDWVSKPDSRNTEEEDWKTHEKNIRILTQIYHHENYNLPIPIHDEIDSSDGPGFTGFIDLNLDRDAEELLINVTDDLDYGYDVTPAPSTPHPSTYQSSLNTDDLCDAINKLYLKELNTEFQSNTVTVEQDFSIVNEEDMVFLQNEVVYRLFQVEQKILKQLIH